MLTLGLFPHLTYHLLVFLVVVFAINPFDIKLKGMLMLSLCTCTKRGCIFITCHVGHRDVTDHGKEKAKAAEEALSSASGGNHHRVETAWRW